MTGVSRFIAAAIAVFCSGALLAGCDPAPTAPGGYDVNGDERLVAFVHEVRRANPDVEYVDALVRAMYADYGMIEARGPVEMEPFRIDGSRTLAPSYYPAGWYDQKCDWNQLMIASFRCGLEGAGAVALWPSKDPYTTTGVAALVTGVCYYQAQREYCEEKYPNNNPGGNGSW